MAKTRAKGRRDKLGIESVYISRPTNLEKNRNLETFVNKTGRKIDGKGNMIALGSMSVTLMRSFDFLGVINSLTPADQKIFQPKLTDFVSTLGERLTERESPTNFGVDSLGFMVSSPTKRQNGIKAVVLMSDSEKNHEVNQELGIIKEVFSEFNLPTPQLAPKKVHLTIGEVVVDKVLSGEGKHPHAILPSGAIVPRSIFLDAPKVEVYKR